MHIHRGRLLRRAAYALILATACVAAVIPVTGVGALRQVAEPWRSAFQDRPRVPASQKVIVVLSFPSLADRVRTAPTPPAPAIQRRWVEEAEQSQRGLVRELRARGLDVTREESFTRTLNGFSATLDAGVLAALEESPAVAGVYPVRVVYPASVTSEAIALTDPGEALGGLREGLVDELDGSGVTVALLDTGVDLLHPYLAGRVLPGIDLIDGDTRAQAALNPDDASQAEQHGTRMAGLIVGAGGPGGARGIAPGANVLPIRVLGWQPTGTGRHAVFGWADALLAGLELAVDPDQDGAVGDAVPIALAPVVEPFAAFADSPEARSVSGASVLGTLVVAASGNDGPADAGSGTVGAPASARAALAVGAVDGRAQLQRVSLRVSVGGASVVDDIFELLGQQSVERTVAWDLTALDGPSLAEPTREPRRLATGELLGDLYTTDGLSRAAGRALLVPSGGGYLGHVTRNAQSAGATAVLVYGDDLEPGSVELSEEAALPVVALPQEIGRAVATMVVRGEEVSIALAPAAPTANDAAPGVAPFSSRGLSFDGVPRPDVVAPGVSLATADARQGAGGDAAYATVTGSSASAAVAAAAAALIVQERPGLSPDQLKAVLVASASPLVSAIERAEVSAQGGGIIDVGAALATTLIVDPPVVALGAPAHGDWTSEVRLELHNLAARPDSVSFALVPDGSAPLPLEFRVDPSSLTIPGRSSADVRLVVSVSDPDASWEGWISGSILVQPVGGPPTRVPFATAFAEDPPAPLVDAARLTPAGDAASDAGLLSILSFRVGWVGESPTGLALGPVALLEVELWKESEFVGTITRLRDLLPGRYSIGLTGRAPDGSVLEPGDYRIRFAARPAVAGFGELVSVSGPAFRVSPPQQDGRLAWAGRYFGSDDREAFEEWLADRGTSYDRWRAAHPAAACSTFGDC